MPRIAPASRLSRAAGLAVVALVVLGVGALMASHVVGESGDSAVAVVTARPTNVAVLAPPDATSLHRPGSAPPTWPFAPPPDLRQPRPGELPSLYADMRPCSVDCRPIGAVDGWPLQPFHRQHPLRAGLNELRGSGFHVGIDIQARDGAKVYSLQPGTVRVLAATGPDARVRVGSYIYWHVRPSLPTGSRVAPLTQSLGTVLPGFGHLHLSEVDAAGSFLNPLRPGGRVLTPYLDSAPPVLGLPRVDAMGGVEVAAFDPQSFVGFTSYRTPVLAPAAVAYRLHDARGRPVGGLEWGLRGTRHLPPADVPRVYAADSGAPGFDCFAERAICVPRWDYRLAGGLAPTLPLGLPAGSYRLTVYAFDWAGNASAVDEPLHLSASGWEPVGRLQPAMTPVIGSGGASGEAAGAGSDGRPRAGLSRRREGLGTGVRHRRGRRPRGGRARLRPEHPAAPRSTGLGPRQPLGER